MKKIQIVKKKPNPKESLLSGAALDSLKRGLLQAKQKAFARNPLTRKKACLGWMKGRG